MWLSKCVEFIERYIFRGSRWLNAVAAISLSLMMFIVAADVVLRYVFNMPIKGSFEIIELLMVLLVFLAIAYTASEKKHVYIETFIQKLPPRGQAIASCFTWLLTLALVVGIAWFSMVRAIENLHAGHQIVSWPIFQWPFVMLTSIGYILISLVFLGNFLDSIARAVKK